MAAAQRPVYFFGVLIAQRMPSRGAEQDGDARQGRGLNSYAAHQRFGAARPHRVQQPTWPGRFFAAFLWFARRFHSAHRSSTRISRTPSLLLSAASVTAGRTFDA